MSADSNLYQKQFKSIKLVKERSSKIEDVHTEIAEDLRSIINDLNLLGLEDIKKTEEYEKEKQENLERMSISSSTEKKTIQCIFEEAELKYPKQLELEDILSPEDFCTMHQRVNKQIEEFNLRYELDKWDYAIAGSCGLFAAMLDILCVKAPPKPTTKYSEKVNGIFNRWVQDAFNKVLPPDLSKRLSEANKIGGADSRTTADLIYSGPKRKIINPENHRLKALSHDPVLGLFFGVWDMIHGTCTVVSDGGINSFPSKGGRVDGNVFQLIGRMLGHLLSDVNAPSSKGNRGMGLPAPFMGILRMFEGIPISDSTFGKQIEWMYVNGYDFRQFVVTSIPMTIMEVMMRAFFVVKQMKQYNANFGETMLDTMPTRLNPRFRIMLAIAYGTSSSINAGKMYITKNLLNANYASWMGLVWNGFFALKWVLLDKEIKLWEGIEKKEIEHLETIVHNLDELAKNADQLPIV